jgi:hypothetical protein
MHDQNQTIANGYILIKICCVYVNGMKQNMVGSLKCFDNQNRGSTESLVESVRCVYERARLKSLAISLLYATIPSSQAGHQFGLDAIWGFEPFANEAAADVPTSRVAGLYFICCSNSSLRYIHLQLK